VTHIYTIRQECPPDYDEVYDLVNQAFATTVHSGGTDREVLKRLYMQRRVLVMKKNSIVLLFVLLVTVLGACSSPTVEQASDDPTQSPVSNQPAVTNPETTLTEAEKEALATYTFLRSFEGNKYQGTAYQFYRAYMLADIETAKGLLANPDDSELLSDFPEESNSLDDVNWLVLKVNEYIPSGENTGQVNAQYEIMEAQSDSVDYLGIDMDYINGEWKVINFYLEK